MVDKVKQAATMAAYTTKEGNTMVTLNIGLQVSEQGTVAPGVVVHPSGKMDWYSVLKVLRSVYGADIVCFVEQSATEPTLVVKIDKVRVPLNTVAALCDLLGQDCIAMHDSKLLHGLDGTVRPWAAGGFLVGPRADQWGTFNEEYFIKWPFTK